VRRVIGNISDRNVALYFAWNRPGEANAHLGILDDRFATIFEIRRVNWPKSEHLAGPAINQGIEGTLEHQVLAGYRAFAQKRLAWTGNPQGNCHSA
jgi:hypothetical protein